MPKLLLINGFSFFFFANEGNEPPHIHVSKAGALAKFWIESSVTLEYSRGYSPSEIHFIVQTIEVNRLHFLSKWYDFFR